MLRKMRQLFTAELLFSPFGKGFLLSSLFVPVSAKHVTARVVDSMRKLSGKRANCFVNMPEKWVFSFDSLTSVYLPIVLLFIRFVFQSRTTIITRYFVIVFYRWQHFVESTESTHDFRVAEYEFWRVGFVANLMHILYVLISQGGGFPRNCHARFGSSAAENFLLSSPCDYQSMKYFCLKRSKGVYEEFFPLHLDSTANFVLVEVPWSKLHCYCSNAIWQFAKCHYLMTQHRVLAKKPTPSTLEGKVSPAIQKYAEMYLGKCTCFSVFQITQLFLDKLTSVLVLLLSYGIWRSWLEGLL